MSIIFAYKVGEIIECLDKGMWKEAYVMRLQPYRGKPGYDIVWHPRPRHDPSRDFIRPSAGGWTYEACMRRKA